MHDSSETTAIRQRMEEVRCDLDEGVQEIVEGARDMGDWRSYVKTYPWICCGAALAAGYLIVPRRPWETLARLAHQSGLLVTSKLPRHGNAGGLLLSLVENLVMRGISSFAVQQAGRLLANQAAKSPQDHQP
jgi:ElaB/YqjD/DUF883 family membrane-anchored ribosome-binding protein